jgi:hypothetical protein
MNMPQTKLKWYLSVTSFLVAFAAATLIYGAVPFLTIPSLGAVVWTSGFAQSFSNSGWPSIYAANFGYPHPAPMVFGLSGGLLQSAFISLLGIPAAPAYTLMISLYLGLALWGALKFAQSLGLPFFTALLMGLAWVSAPMVWAHGGYLTLSLGIALLPFYLWGAQLLCRVEDVGRRTIFLRSMGFIAISVLAIFMDGYTYVMFEVGTFVLVGYALFREQSPSRPLLRSALPAVITGFALSYWLYIRYVGVSTFALAPMDFFRGWGADVMMFFIPTEGLHWLWHSLGFEMARSTVQYFGDESVWRTTFSALFIVFGIAGLWLTRNRQRAYPLLLLALFGAYMSLGPSLKFHSVRPKEDIQAGNLNPMMGKKYAIAPTGNALLSESLPGFKNMRASYRWMALGLFGFWALAVLLIVELHRREQRGAALCLALLLIISNLPAPHNREVHVIPIRLQGKLSWNSVLSLIDRDLAGPLRAQIAPGSFVAFLPLGNDFLANYLSSVGGFRTYNIGGDKNLEIAEKKWPETVTASSGDDLPEYVYDAENLLFKGDVDYVVLPFVDLLGNALQWPPTEESVRTTRNALAATLEQLELTNHFDIVRDQYFAVISLTEHAKALDVAQRLTYMANRARISPGEGLLIGWNGYKVSSLLLRGWHTVEATHVWSQSDAELRIYVDKKCRDTECFLRLNIAAFAASKDHPVKVEFYTKGSETQPLLSLTRFEEQFSSVSVPIRPADLSSLDELTVRILVPAAQSPQELGRSSDARKLGIALRSLELEAPKLHAFACLPPSCLRWMAAQNPYISRQVGQYQDASFVSDGHAGFLTAGPFLRMQSGKYRLRIFGTGQEVAGAWADIVDNQIEKTILGPTAFSPSTKAAETLMDREVSIDSEVNNLGVRIFAGAQSDLQLKGYELIPVK